LSKELEESESQLKKTETLHLDAQRKIRELERQIHMQKDHNSEVRNDFRHWKFDSFNRNLAFSFLTVFLSFFSYCN